MLIFEKVNIIAIVLTKLIGMRILAKANLQRLCRCYVTALIGLLAFKRSDAQRAVPCPWSICCKYYCRSCTEFVRIENRLCVSCLMQRLCENDFLNYYSMSKIRKYDSSPSMATMKVLEGSRVEFIAHYYPAKGFYAPRYHFENFNLSFAELNYEISRFIRFVCKLTADPSFGSRLDYADSELDMKYGVEGF